MSTAKWQNIAGSKKLYLLGMNHECSQKLREIAMITIVTRP